MTKAELRAVAWLVEEVSFCQDYICCDKCPLNGNGYCMDDDHIASVIAAKVEEMEANDAE